MGHITLSASTNSIEDIRLIHQASPAAPETPALTSTPTPLSDDPARRTPKPTIALTPRELELKDLSANIPGIWFENNIPLTDMLRPGRTTYSGFVRVGQEYRFSAYWCATNTNTLRQNIENIRMSFYVNGELLAEKYILVYDHNPENLKCKYATVVLGGWVPNEEYKLEVHQTFLTEIFDGKTSYPAWTYIRELSVTAMQE